MNLNWSKQHELFRTELCAFLQQHADWAPRTGGARPQGDGLRWQKLLIEKGYACRTVPALYGGFGADPDPLIGTIIAEEFARMQMLPGLSNQGISMLVPTVLAYGTELQKERWVRSTITGDTVWCQGYSEPGAGSDLANLRTKAVLEGDEWVINGHKIWTSTAQFADMMFCLVRTEDEEVKKHGAISYLLIPMDSAGIEVRPLVTMTGASEFNEVFFTDVRIPAESMVGERGQGWVVANNTLKHERGMLGDPDAALMRFNRLVALLQNESPEGEALIKKPLIRDRLMQLQARLWAMRANAMRLLCSHKPDQSDTLARLSVKLNGCELNYQISRLAIDALEEVGILYEAGEHLRDRGSWQWQNMFQLGLIIGGGTAQIQKNIISERGLNMPRGKR
ncbi:MAG: acyl-CoA dehydrogenase family protein [Gammaproteobacteria bacterium]